MDVNFNQKHTYIYMPCSFLRHFILKCVELGQDYSRSGGHCHVGHYIESLAT